MEEEEEEEKEEEEKEDVEENKEEEDAISDIVGGLGCGVVDGPVFTLLFIAL